MTVEVPQLRRGDNNLFMWNRDDLQLPVHTFIGHADAVLDFHWKKSSG